MARPVSIRRCPLARLASLWEGSDLEPDLRALAVNLARRVRRETPDVNILVRMNQALALQIWVKAQTDSADLMALNRALSELNRSLRTLGFRAPTDAGRRSVSSLYRPSRQRAVDPESDEGQEDDDAA